MTLSHEKNNSYKHSTLVLDCKTSYITLGNLKIDVDKMGVTARSVAQAF